MCDYVLIHSRFDFTVGVFSAPTTAGVCGGANDKVTITSPGYTSGQLTPTGLLCGTVTGQHGKCFSKNVWIFVFHSDSLSAVKK